MVFPLSSPAQPVALKASSLPVLTDAVRPPAQPLRRSPRQARDWASLMKTSPLGAWPIAALLAIACCCGCGGWNGAAEIELPTESAAEWVEELHQQRLAGQWPGWRGGAIAQGVVSGPPPAVRWSLMEGIRWQVPVPGIGNSSPVVWDERIYLTSVEGTGANAQVVALCFDRETGLLLWRQTLGRPAGRTHAKNGYASATMATDGQRVYAFAGDQGLYCFDREGTFLWQRRPAEVDQKWGHAASPILYGDLVVQLCDSETQSALVAYDKRTGELRWRTPRVSSGSWSTPALVEGMTPKGPRWELVVSGTGSLAGAKGYVIAYDPESGREYWRVRGTTDITVPTAIVGEGLIVSSSGGNGPILAIEPGGTGDVSHSHVRWQRARGGPYVPTGVLHNGLLFIVTDRGIAGCYDPADGNPIWTERLGQAFSASLIAADGRLYAVSESGNVFVLAADRRFQLLAINDLEEVCTATPAVSRGELFLRTAAHLVCVAAPTTDELPPSEAPTPAESAEQAAKLPPSSAPSSPEETSPSPSDEPLPSSADVPLRSQVP